MKRQIVFTKIALIFELLIDSLFDFRNDLLNDNSYEIK